MRKLSWAISFGHGRPAGSASAFSLERAVASQATWWDKTPWEEPDRGFIWYPDPMDPKPERKKDVEPPPRPKTIYEMTTLEEIKKELERIKGDAVVNPTEEKVLAFLRAQNWVMDKASLFADVSRRAVWRNPDVNYAARSPVANFAVQNARQRQTQERKDTIKALASTHGILYFARSDCNFCKDQSPVLKAFSTATGMPVLTISMDGGPISMFPDAKKTTVSRLLARATVFKRFLPSFSSIVRPGK
ncbi:MAG: conjugal transfer protein TraF [Propionivibrio sp.]|uniref:Conjugal transfer protein TraF n=1 Tax=Candidatus Propionivibrio dominans TaxID=2954373 RepID=A0A9D7FMM3_9RHOO|nr:conjugal transfer protein TraF [Candidatus Propionivibrio dominans]